MATTNGTDEKWFALFRTESRIRAIPKNWKGWAAIAAFFLWMAAPPIIWAATGMALDPQLWHLIVFLAYAAVSLFFWIRLVIRRTDRVPFNRPRNQ